ncbi:MAG: ferritin-like domain-containing protein [Actinomycetota bacterium]|jgi:hypothetical protein
MEISERELLSLAGEVDDLHRQGMETMHEEIRALHAETRGFRRRSARNRAAVGGGALSVGGLTIPFARVLPVAAQSLTDGDIAAFAESVELVAVEAYKAAAGSGKLQAGVKTVGEIFATHHQAHAQAFAGASGGKATGKPNARLLTAVGPDLTAAIAAGQTKILEFAQEVENMATATYMFALGALQSTAALQLTASILPVESQHATILGMALGQSGAQLFPTAAFETDTAKIDPAMFPVA